MSGVPYIFGNATTSIPLSQLDVNFATNATLGNATVGLGNTTTTVGNLTVQNVTLSSTNGDANIHGLTVGQGGGSVSTNTAVGASALAANTTGSVNSAFGYQAGYSLTTGTFNSFFGENSAYYQTTGSYNIAIGQGALQGVSGQSNTGSYNTAVGNNALLNNTTASNNTAVGYQAGYTNSTGAQNSFLGYQSGSGLTTGSNNVLAGFIAGQGVTTGSGNVLIGAYQFTSLTTGGYNTMVGYNVASSSASVSGAICITAGNANPSDKGTNTGFITPNGGGVYQGNNSTLWSVTSDERLKKNIVDNTVGLTAINGIKVRNFEYRLPEEITDLDKSNAVNITGTQLGPIAQELQQILPDCVKTESTGVMSVDSSDVLWHLVTAVQQLSAQVTALQAKVGV